MTTLSIRLRPGVGALLEQRCREQGVNKSQLINDLIEQSLGAQCDGRHASELLDELLQDIEGSGDKDSAKNISSRLKKTLRAKHTAR